MKGEKERTIIYSIAIWSLHLSHALPVCFSFISLLSFLPSSTLSPPSSFFSLLPLSAAITYFFLPRLKYEYFRAKKLKGNNEMARKLNYTPLIHRRETFLSNEHTSATWVCLLLLQTEKLVVSCFYVRSVIFPQTLLIQLQNKAGTL